MKTSTRYLAVLAFAVVLAAASGPAFAAEGGQGVVNINTASATELELLPGVGPALAGRIVQHRDKNGAFRSADDLMLVRGIGEKSLERLRPYIVTSGATTLTEPVRLPRAPKQAKQPKHGEQ